MPGQQITVLSQEPIVFPHAPFTSYNGGATLKIYWDVSGVHPPNSDLIGYWNWYLSYPGENWSEAAHFVGSHLMVGCRGTLMYFLDSHYNLSQMQFGGVFAPLPPAVGEEILMIYDAFG